MKSSISFPTIPGTPLPLVELVPLRPTHAALVHAWVSDEQARAWLDLGSGRRDMSQRDLYLQLSGPRTWARLFRLPGTEAPLGLVCLNDVHNEMGSAEIWGMRGNYAPSAPRNVVAAAFLLGAANGFIEFGRQVIGSWVVEGNALSASIQRQLGAVETGRQRHRHVIGGRRLDRLLFDFTRDEFADRFPSVPGESGRTMREVSHA
jgi:RimJ/RimL family protein N-acetyltransferase